MLTEKDRKYLERITGRQGGVTQVVFFLAGSLIMGIALFNFYLAGWIASYRGYTFLAFLQRWGEDASASKAYSGIFMMASQFMTIGVGEVFFSLFILIFWRRERRERERAQRTINTLKSAHAWD